MLLTIETDLKLVVVELFWAAGDATSVEIEFKRIIAFGTSFGICALFAIIRALFKTVPILHNTFFARFSFLLIMSVHWALEASPLDIQFERLFTLLA